MHASLLSFKNKNAMFLDWYVVQRISKSATKMINLRNNLYCKVG